jgi:hypothetical protein
VREALTYVRTEFDFSELERPARRSEYWKQGDAGAFLNRVLRQGPQQGYDSRLQPPNPGSLTERGV